MNTLGVYSLQIFIGDPCSPCGGDYSPPTNVWGVYSFQILIAGPYPMYTLEKAISFKPRATRKGVLASNKSILEHPKGSQEVPFPFLALCACLLFHMVHCCMSPLHALIFDIPSS